MLHNLFRKGAEIKAVDVHSTPIVFAAVKDDGSVITWGFRYRDPGCNLAGGVRSIFSTCGAVAALKGDGSVTTWGEPDVGGKSTSVKEQLAGGVRSIFSTGLAFAALKDNGSVTTWGDPAFGGNSTGVQK